MFRQPRLPLPVLLMSSLVFGGATAFFGYGLVRLAADAFRLRDAATVAATVSRVEWVKVRQKRGTREETLVTYRYDFAGEHHQNRTRRLTLFADDEDLRPRLEEAARTGAPVQILVSRSDPTFSVFSRRVEPWAVIVLALFALGFAGPTLVLVREWKRRARDLLLQTEKSQRNGRTPA